jgi:exodeoxyribonuclease VII small subunit
MDEAKINEMTFEQAIARLEQIVRALDGGNAPLDESLALFEEGVALVKLCNSKLDKAEQRVKILVAGTDGEMSEIDFNDKT